MTKNEPLVTSAEAVRIWRQQRYSPIRSATPATLARALEAFEIGDLREGALLFESIADRDDTLMSVKPKREKEVSQLDRQVMAIPGSGRAGEEHKEILKDFWNNVTAINAYDRNQKGKFRRLVKQMMTSVSFRYAAHHIVWSVRNGKLRATFEFVPLWLFENRTGTLRYLRNPWATEGELLADGEWMVTAGDGLMIACSIGWSAKRNAFNDWLIFSAKFSVPGTLGRTSAAKDSPEGRAMHEAVRTFGHDWAGVIYGDDGTHDEPIKIIQAAGNPSGMPMPAVVERVDRKFAALYRGADLSTMSAGGGEGSGASLQEKEGDILLADDAETINETLEEISKKVIEWHFGYGVEPLAKLELIVPKREDTTNLVTDATALADRGAKVSKSALMERLSLQTASDEADTLGAAAKQQDGKAQGTGIKALMAAEEIANAMDEVALSEWLFEIRSALANDMQPLGDALMGALEAGDLPAMQAALRKISIGMPELAGDAANLAEVLGGQFADAWLGNDAEEVANADRGKPVAYFYAGGIRRPIYASAHGTALSAGGKSMPLSISKQAGSINAALAAATARQQGQSFSLGRVDDALAKRILAATDALGDPRDVTGMEWRIDSDFVAHARRFHPNLTDDDFLQIPALIANAPIIEPSQNDRGFPTVNFRMKRSQREYLLVSVQFDKRRHLSLNTLKKSAEGKTL